MGAKSQRLWFSGFVGCLSVTMVLIALLVKLFQSEITYISGLEIFFSGIVAVICTVMGCVCLHIYTLDPSDSMSLAAIKNLYTTTCSGLWHGRAALKVFIKGCNKVTEKQERLLLDLLKKNSDTVYGKDHKFCEIDTIEKFRNMHPLCDYEQFRPYVEKICNGEKNVLTTNPPFGLAKTSGTTGEAKRIAVSNLAIRNYLYIFFYHTIVKGAKLNMKKTIVLGNTPKVETTKSGLKCGPLTYFHSHYLLHMASPAGVFNIMHENTSFYVHGLFACTEREIGNMSLLFAFQAYTFFRFLHNNWEDICNDIEHGTLSCKDLIIENKLKEQIQVEMKADPERANELREEFQKGSTRLALRLWPDLSYCRVTGTGSMDVYRRLLQKEYLKDVILVPNGYGGSEGFYGMNITNILDDPTYHLVYDFQFFEFIPEEDIGQEQPKTLLAHELKIGQNYEMLFTNDNGLYRYRMGDVVKITGYTHQCPIIEFVYRTGQVLNILGEKTPEMALYRAVDLACSRLHVTLIDYTSCEDLHLHGIKVLDDYKRHYVLFVELSKVISVQESQEFDKTLCEVSEIYNTMRTNRQSVAPMEVIQVIPGTFILLKDRMIKETQNQQYKLPRALRKEEHLKWLLKYTCGTVNQ